MASSAIPANPTPANVSQLLPKLHDADPDFRYMALNDLLQIFNIAMPNFLQHDYQLCIRTIDGLLNTLNDNNGDVQNMAIKCLGPFVNKCPDTVLCPMIEKVSLLSTGSTVDSSIPALALREIVVSLPRPISGAPRSKGVLDAYNALSKALIPRLVGYTVMPLGRKDMPSPPKGMLENDIASGNDSNAIDVLTEVARCFGPMLHEKEIEALLRKTYDILEAERAGSVLKKKAVIAISTLATHFSDALLSSFISKVIENLRDVHLIRSKRKLYITILGSMARSIPRKFGPYLKMVAPFVLSALSAEELDEEMTGTDDEGERDPEADEVREAALVALEAFLGSCPSDMVLYTDETISACVRFLKYDPNVAEDDEGFMEDDDEDDALEGDDFEEEGGYDDEDDVSWKVRRSAAKALSTLVTTRGKGDLLEDDTLYEKVAPALVSRFKEREESVRLEILSTFSALVRVTRDDGATPALALHDEGSQSVMGPPPSRKRRRGGSDASMFDSQTNKSISLGLTSPVTPTPLTGPRVSLAKIVPDVVRGASQLLKTGPLPTKQATIILLKDVVITQQGRLDEYLGQLMDPVIDAIKTSGSHQGLSGGSSSSVTANSLRIEALQCLGAIANWHSSKVLEPFLPKLIPVVTAASQEKYSKVSVEALIALEEVTKAVTPPRASAGSRNGQFVEQIYDVLAKRTASKDVDLEVRQRAVYVLALLLGLTSSSNDLLPQEKRQAGLELLLERLKNELTRLATARAISELAALTQSGKDLNSEWVCSVCLELGAQLRKASRSLRGASLRALEVITVTPACREHIDANTTNQIVELLLPLLTTNDLHLLRPALVILTTFVHENGKEFVTDQLNDAICDVVQSSVTGGSVNALQGLVRAIGEQGAGKALMLKLLNVGVAGNPDLLGKAVGTLLVYGGSDLGVKLEQFVGELKQNDERKQGLAITVLGEAGLLMGENSPLTPDVFTGCFSAKGEQLPLTAAIALGRAGAGNVEGYLPKILQMMGQKDSPQYLLMHSIKELLQHKEAEDKVKPYAQTLWQNLVAGSQVEDNRAIGAECIGRLAIIEPEEYLPQLQSFLGDKNPGVRGMVVSALRFTLADTDVNYNSFLQPIVLPMLTAMLNDADLDNRRSALTTFNSAMHNKPELVLPHLDELLPLAMRETVVKPELIREVQMGPFKHKVDDGLELRKSAYETLYALLESAFHRIPLPDFFDRIIAGIGDDNDIRILCNLMLTKLLYLAPDETMKRLQAISEKFRAVLSTKAKENAVKQEIEKLAEASKGVLKVSLNINKVFPEGGSYALAENPNTRAWIEYWEWVKKDLTTLLKLVEEEVRDKERP